MPPMHSQAGVGLMDNYVAGQVHPPSGGDRLAPRPRTHPSKLVTPTGAVSCHLCVCSRASSHSLTLTYPSLKSPKCDPS
eukprot:scaffold26732_cov65-Phaeocystis_antarctica.AAC.2